MTQRSFIKAVKRAEIAPAPEEAPIVFDLSTYDEDPEGVPLENGRGGPLLDADGNQVIGHMRRQNVFTATRPSEDQMLISLVQGGRTDAPTADRVAVIFDFFRYVLPPNEHRILMDRVKDRDDEIDTDTLTDIFEWLQEEWTDFPTESPSASSRRRPTSGKSSTGRSPGKGSTASKTASRGSSGSSTRAS